MFAAKLTLESTPPLDACRRPLPTPPSPTSSRCVSWGLVLLANVQAEIADPSHDDEPKSGSTGARPSRKVVDPPGGKQNIRLFGEEYEETDALSLAPPPNGGSGVDVDIERMEHLKVHVEPEVDGGATVTDIKDAAASAADNSADRVSNPPSNFRPSRKVREGESSAVKGGTCSADQQALAARPRLVRRSLAATRTRLTRTARRRVLPLAARSPPTSRYVTRGAPFSCVVADRPSRAATCGRASPRVQRGREERPRGSACSAQLSTDASDKSLTKGHL